MFFFFFQNPPILSSHTNRGITLDRPIATLFSSNCDKRSKAHTTFSFAINVPVFRALANGLIAPDEAISPLF
ncbi:hypothetical protein OIU79_021198 [Salix purpurea]|uniref:Uncharacterized protein n=1 Tax=Salix purpurea TaxID=77065 RepID=A0A9Q0WRN6_SALPP|nr:hypothetical protein OIU79_021198 [Salix purpurea]